MTSHDFEVNATGTRQTLSSKDMEIEHLKELVRMGRAVVDDFLPNIGQCALQDYGRLNEFMIQSREFSE